MGMDVIGKKPRSVKGEYFRNNIWWWHPLWHYCCSAAPSVIDSNTAMLCHSNVGGGLGTRKARKLASILREEVRLGRVRKHARALRELDAQHGIDEKNTHQPFDEENVLEFIDFLEDCGGFEVC